MKAIYIALIFLSSMANAQECGNCNGQSSFVNLKWTFLTANDVVVPSELVGLRKAHCYSKKRPNEIIKSLFKFWAVADGREEKVVFSGILSGLRDYPSTSDWKALHSRDSILDIESSVCTMSSSGAQYELKVVRNGYTTNYLIHRDAEGYLMYFYSDFGSDRHYACHLLE